MSTFAHLHGPGDEGQQKVKADDDTIAAEKTEEEAEEEKEHSKSPEKWVTIYMHYWDY